MPSQTKEDYLKALYFLADEAGKLQLSELSKSLNVSNPTANSMVKKLEEAGWVSYVRYKPLQVTPKGQKVAALIVRKHRITEMFLTEIMGFGWEEVHDIAEEMEHLASDKLFDRMDEMLGYPTEDPHGSPIPDAHGRVAENQYHKLSSLKVGQRARLCAVNQSSQELLMLLNSKSLQLGSEMEVLEVAPFDKSITISRQEMSNTMLSHEVCEQLLVEVLKVNT